MILLSKSIAKYCKFMFVKYIEVPYSVFASPSFSKKITELYGRGQSPHASFEKFQGFLVLENTKFSYFLRINTNGLSKQLKKKKILKLKLEKTLVSPRFSNLNLGRYFLYVSVHVMSLYILASNAYCLSMNERARFGH